MSKLGILFQAVKALLAFNQNFTVFGQCPDSALWLVPVFREVAAQIPSRSARAYTSCVARRQVVNALLLEVSQGVSSSSSRMLSGVPEINSM